MKRKILLILPALQQAHDRAFRLIKYSRFPPLSPLTLASVTPRDEYDVIVRDEHIESSEVEGDVDLVGIQTYVSSATRAYELAALWRRRGAKVVLGGIHPTTLPAEAAAHADGVYLGDSRAPDVGVGLVPFSNSVRCWSHQRCQSAGRMPRSSPAIWFRARHADWAGSA